MAKAVNGATIAFFGAIGTTLLTGHVAWYQWLGAAGAATVTFTGIYATNPPE